MEQGINLHNMLSLSSSTSSMSAQTQARRLASKADAQIDAGLVGRFVQEGSNGAFEEIVTRHREKLFSIALSLLRNRNDAEEVVQDAFVRAHRGLANFRGDSSLATWLHHITVNLARNRYWYFHRRHRQDSLSLDHQLNGDSQTTFSDLIASEAPTAQREAAITEFSELVTLCLEKLDPSHREILKMRAVLNQSYDEIADALGVKVGTVKSRIARARGHLRSKMVESCPEFNENTLPVEWFESERQIGAVA